MAVAVGVSGNQKAHLDGETEMGAAGASQEVAAKMMEEEGGGAMPAVAVGCQSEIHSPRSPCHTRRQKPSIQRRHPHSRRSRSARTSPSR